jgi:hypothetical protein
VPDAVVLGVRAPLVVPVGVRDARCEALGDAAWLRVTRCDTLFDAVPDRDRVIEDAGVRVPDGDAPRLRLCVGDLEGVKEGVSVFVAVTDALGLPLADADTVPDALGDGVVVTDGVSVSVGGGDGVAPTESVCVGETACEGELEGVGA